MNSNEALADALDYIAIAAGREEDLTPAQRRKRDERRLAALETVRDGLRQRAEDDAAKERDEQGWSAIDPVTAYIVGWFLRKEADSDHVISMDGKATDALEEAASHIESGEILADPQEMLAELDDEIAALKVALASVDTHAERHDPEEGHGPKDG